MLVGCNARYDAILVPLTTVQPLKKNLRMIEETNAMLIIGTNKQSHCQNK